MKSLKVLAIGNSFSVDAMQWLYNIADDCGVEEILLGNAYIGGAPLNLHWDNAENNLPAYTYYKNTYNEWIEQNHETILNIIKDEDWDIITLQQRSAFSGITHTYEPYLTNLINYVNSNKKNANAKLYWHMTWAYEAGCDHPGFSDYNCDQMQMYNSIVNAIKQLIIPNDEFIDFIPSGTAIQNARTSYIGDILTRDGYHLSYNLGRFIAGMTWFAKLTGLSIDNVKYVPSSDEIKPEILSIVKESVNNAILKPLEVTQSKYIADHSYKKTAK